MNWFKRAYSTEIGRLKDYLRTGFDPYDYIYAVRDYLISNGKDIDEDKWSDIEDGENWINDASPGMIDSFENWLSNFDMSYEIAIDSPSYESLRFKNLKKNIWLIHFTNNAHGISTEGFKIGYPDFRGLDITGGQRSLLNTTPTSGYNFAFDISNTRSIYKHSRSEGYGKEAVVFLSPFAIEVEHIGDEEPQMIFWGDTINPNLIFPIEQIEGYYYEDNTPDGWAILDDNTYKSETYPIYSSGDIINVINYITNNYQMLQNKLGKKK